MAAANVENQPYATLAEGVATAQSLLARGDHEGALQIWTTLRRLFPGERGPVVRAASTLAQMGRYGEADRLLDEHLDRFKDDAAFAIERARLAQSRRDLPAAIRLWEEIRERFPTHPAGFVNGAASLRDARRFDEAEAVAAAAVARFPNEPAPLIEHAWVAHVRRDFREAVARWTRVRDRFPENPWGFTNKVAALRELGRLDDAQAAVAEAVMHFPDLPGPRIEGARVAQARRDWPQAIARWETVRSMVPDNIAGYMGGAAAMLGAARREAAESLLRVALDRFPGDIGPAIEFARIPQVLRDWSEAARRWEAARRRFPNHLAAHLGTATSLRQAGRVDEAEAAAAEAIERFPAELAPMVEHAWTAHSRRDWPEAALRWDRIRQRFPETVTAYSMGSSALREDKRFDEAERVATAALQRFPNDAGIMVEHARVAQSRRDWFEAVGRWSRVIERFPDNPAGYVGSAASLRAADRIDDAEILAEAAMARFPAEPGPHIEYAWTATVRSDWPEAVRRWQRVCEQFPNHPAGPAQRAAAVAELERLVAAMAPPSATAEPDPIATQDGMTKRAGHFHQILHGLWQRVSSLPAAMRRMTM